MIKRFTFIRHTEVCSEPTSHGILLAKKRAHSLKDYSLDLVITSSALRTKKTARIILQTINIDIPTVSIKELYLPLDINKKEIVENILQDFDKKPISMHDPEDAWDCYAKQAYCAIKKAVCRHKAKNILIIGHGHIINSIGLIINPNATELENIYFGYCEGFSLFSKSCKILI